MASTVPDQDRYSSYEPVTPTTAFPVGFTLFAGNAVEAKGDLVVSVDGVPTSDFDVQGTFTGDEDATVCNDGEVVFYGPLSGVKVEVEGWRDARRIGQWPDAQGVPPRFQNFVQNVLQAEVREIQQRLLRAALVPYGEEPLTPAQIMALVDAVTSGPVSSVNGQTGVVLLGKSDLGLANVENYPVADQAEAEAGGATNRYMTPQRVAQAIAALSAGLRFPAGHLYGFTLSNNVTDAANDIDIEAGECRDDGNTANMILASGLTKRLDANWVVGNNLGGLDTGSKANNRWYHVFAIRRPDTGVVDVLFSTSATSPTMPANYTQKRRLGAVRTGGSGAIISFVQTGSEFRWTTPVTDFTSVSMGTSAVVRTLTVPTGVSVVALVSFRLIDGSAGGEVHVYISSLDETDIAATSANSDLSTGTGISSADVQALFKPVRTNTSAQIRTRASASASDQFLRGATRGWMDARGQDA